MPDHFFCQFDVKDWRSDDRVTDLTMAERGLYLELLWAQFISSDGMLPADEAKLAKRARCDLREFKKLWKNVAVFFEKKGENLSNSRMKKTLNEVQKSASKRSEAGKKGAKARWGACESQWQSHRQTHCDCHTESQCDRNGNQNQNQNKNQNNTRSDQDQWIAIRKLAGSEDLSTMGPWELGIYCGWLPSEKWDKAESIRVWTRRAQRLNDMHQLHVLQEAVHDVETDTGKIRNPGAYLWSKIKDHLQTTKGPK